jgi:L-ascorbate metabolism protein UlaG (beta-lactamase superfamily)
MRTTFFVNAMVLLEGQTSRILCDPWVTFGNESDSGFFNFPRATLTREEVQEIRPDYIYITHTHPDHFDPITLKLFDAATPILVSSYEHNFTERAVRGLGFHDVRVVPLNDGMALGDEDYVWMEPSARNPEVDSIAVFRLDGETVVNVNDNVFDQTQCQRLREQVGGINVALVPSGAHGPWPMFFDSLSDTEKAQHAAKRAQLQKESFVAYIEAFRPRFVVPIAGGIMCGGAKAKMYPYSGIRPRSEVVAYAREHVSFDFEPVMLSERCSFDTATGQRQGGYVEKSLETETAYIDELARVPSLFGPGGKFYVAPSERIDLSGLLCAARQNQQRWQQRYGTKSEIAYYFDVGEQLLYRLSLADDKVSRVRESDIPDDRYEIFRLPYELLLGMVQRDYVWSNVNTQHMSFYRKGDSMDPELMVLLNYLQI